MIHSNHLNKNNSQNNKTIGFIDLNEHKGLIMAALNECSQHQLLGSIGNQEAINLFQRLKYEDYCIKRGITYEEMTDDDFYNAYEEEMREKEIDNDYGN